MSTRPIGGADANPDGAPHVRRSRAVVALVAAAETEFAERGYAGATVEGICRTAGVSRMTYYRHFRDKQAVFHHLAREFLASTAPHVAELLAQPPGREHAAGRRQAAREYVLGYLRHPGVARAWSQEVDRDEFLAELTRESTREVRTAFAGAVGRAAAGDRELAAAYAAIAGFVERFPYMTAVPLQLDGFPPAVERIADVMASFVESLVGVLARPPSR